MYWWPNTPTREQILELELQTKEKQLEYIAQWRFGPKQRALYFKLYDGYDAIKRELELRKIEERR